jgi:multidrug efflux system membrane fusion protein
MKMKKIIGLVAALLVLWWVVGKFSSDSKKNTSPTVKVSLAEVVRRDVPISISLPANVIAYETVAIKSRIDSQITQVKFHDGDMVKQGEELFILDDRSLKAQLKQLEAGLQKEKAQLENTRMQYERAKNLSTNKFLAQSQLDDAKAAYNSQQAAANAAQANLDNTSVLLSYSTITAPISGRAGTINVTQGNNVKANDPQALVTINRISPIRVQFSIPERYYEKVKSAMTGTVPVIASRQENSEPVQGKLEYIDNTIDPATGSFIARAIFANEQESLWPGMFVTINLELGKETGKITIPTIAVQGDEGNHFVFKMVDNKAVKTPIDISNESGDIAIVSKGLVEGEQVVVDGLLRVTDGALIETAGPKK